LMEQKGAGELVLNSVDRDGMMEGFDLELIREISHAVSIPVIASGGAGNLAHLKQAIEAGASAVAAGSMFVFQGKHRAVLISYPSQTELSSINAL
jgi:cyclase